MLKWDQQKQQQIDVRYYQGVRLETRRTTLCFNPKSKQRAHITDFDNVITAAICSLDLDISLF